jgi:hypothetical protein
MPALIKEYIQKDLNHKIFHITKHLLKKEAANRK